MTELRTFVLNLTDLQFILSQLNFIPLFSANGDAVIAWDGTTAVYDTNGVKLYDPATHTGSYNGTPLTSDAQALSVLGQSFPTSTSFVGLRDVSGLHNNLNGGEPGQTWGVVDHPFIRLVPGNFVDYLGADYTPSTFDPVTGTWSKANVVDAAPRMISQTITTGGLTFLTDAGNHIMYWNQAAYDTAGSDLRVKVDAWNAAADAYNLANPTLPPKLIIEPGKQIDGAAVVTDYGRMNDIGNPDYQNSANGEVFVGATNPGVAPANGWFALFGQFFDHGLDFIDKSSAYGTITIPLSADDPLYGSINPTTGQPVFSIKVSRAVIAGNDANGDPNYINHTSPYIDQSQTYGSNEQVTNILREWVLDPKTGSYHAGFRMYDGDSLGRTYDGDSFSTTATNGWTKNVWNPITEAWEAKTVHDTLPTLHELNAHLIATGRDPLTWDDVVNLRARDDSGKLVDADHDASNGVQTVNTGHALLLDMNPHFDNGHFSAATETALANTFVKMVATPPGAPAGTPPFMMVVTTADDPDGHAIVPDANGNYSTTDLSAIINFANFSAMATNTTEQTALAKQVLFESVSDHYVAGDGRANENFGLTTIHHVFHEEHNYQVDNLMAALNKENAHQMANNDFSHTLLHGYQVNTGAMDSDGNYLYTNADGTLYVDASGHNVIAWDNEKLFNGAKLVVEMEYQHTAVDQYARSVTPDIPEFVGYNSGVDASLSLEYAQSAFRFGHSTLRETIDTIDPDGGLTGQIMSYALEAAFLNPQKFAEIGPGAIALGMTHQQMAEIDEIITPALNQGLLGQPLDLGAINIARGRDIGLPTLNDVREAMGFARYGSWASFGEAMIHPSSLASFIAAYAFNGDQAAADEVVGLADGSIASAGGANGWTFSQALAFLNNSGDLTYKGNVVKADTFNLIDTWIGGLAEAHIMGGLLGETFNAIFVDQIVRLMDGDRFYYLYRLVNQQFGDEVGNEQFKDIIERNTGVEHLNGSAFSYADAYYEVDKDANATTAGIQNDLGNHKYGATIDTNHIGVYSRGGMETSNGEIIQYVAPETKADARNGADIDGLNVTFAAGPNVVSKNYVLDMRENHNPNAVNLDDTPVSGADSNEVYVGSNYDDVLYMGAGDDTAYGEDGNDIIYGGEGIDRLYGGDGDDYIHGGGGGELIDGGNGRDVIWGDSSGTAAAGFNQVIGGAGNDIIYAGQGIDKIAGGGGDDIIYGLGDTDPFTHGGDGNDYIDGGQSGDLLYGDNGDDVIVGGNDQDVLMGGDGDDIMRPGNPSSSLAGFGPDEVLGGDGIEDTGFDLIDFSDYLAGTPHMVADMTTQNNPLQAIDATTPFPAWFQIEGVIGTQSGDEVIGDDNANWIIGGSGADTMTGAGGNDVMIGDKVRLDSLIGTYSGAYTYYDDYVLADDRTSGSLQNNGLLDRADLGTTMFDKHFTELLKSKMFANYQLGNDGGAASGADMVTYANSLNNYDVTRINFTGAHGEQLVAFRISGKGGSAAQGDGTDLVVGVEKFSFAGTVYNATNASPYFDSYILGANRQAPATALGPNDNPIVATNVAENTAGTVAYVHAVDPDAGQGNNPFGGASTLTYTLTGADANLFTLTRVNGNSNYYALAFKNAPNFEALPANDKVLDVNVVVSDGIASDTQSFAFNITDVLEPTQGTAKVDSWSLNAGNTTEHLVVSSILANPSTGEVVDATGYQFQRTGGGNNPVTSMTFDAVTKLGAGDLAVATGNNNSVTYNVWAVAPDGLTPNGTTRIYAETVSIGRATGNDTFSGADSTNNNRSDLLLGLGGNDTLTGGQGNDTVDGGDGNDTAVFSGIAGNYTITATSASTDLTVADASGNNGTDKLIGIENLRFASGGFGGNTTYQIVRGTDNVDALNFAGSNTNRAIFAFDGAETITGGSSNDIILAGAGDDTILQTSTGAGRDVVSGGAGTDTYKLTTNSNSVENITIYTRAAALAAAQNNPLLAFGLGTLGATTEIVIVRGVTGQFGVQTFSVLSELSGVEEIIVNGTANTITSGQTGSTISGDNIAVVGDFTNTALHYQTITINGSSQGETVDITGLDSAHRIVFNTNGGGDQVIGDHRMQDVVNGDATYQLPVDPVYGSLIDDDTLNGGDEDNEIHGLDGDDTINGMDGDDDLFGDDGDDNLSGDDGDDNLEGGDGDDDLDGDDGDDTLVGGFGKDKMTGDLGNDTFVAGNDDGDDGMNGGDGDDTADYSSVAGNITVRMRQSSGNEGWVDGKHTGHDHLKGVENVITGSGNDIFYAGRGANTFTGGAGNDVFVFNFAATANGDTINDFGGGDWVDLHRIDADTRHKGNQAFTVVDGDFTHAGQLSVSYQGTGADEVTIIKGNTDRDQDAEFTLTLNGHHTLADHFLL